MLRRAVVFDMDETIGYFSQLGLIIDSLENHIKPKKLNQKELYHMMDIFHNIFRPGILDIFRLLKREKKKNKQLKVVMFTNNTGPKSWMHLIRKYIEYKTKSPDLFDKVIGAWKVKGEEKPREECRTSYEKTYVDLLNCYPTLARYKICFLDDVIHEGMKNHKNIKYLHLKPYRHEISYDTIVDTLIGSPHFKHYIGKRSEYINYLKTYLNKDFFEYKHINKLKEKKYAKSKLYKIIFNFVKNKKARTRKRNEQKQNKKTRRMKKRRKYTIKK